MKREGGSRQQLIVEMIGFFLVVWAGILLTGDDADLVRIVSYAKCPHAASGFRFGD